MRLLVITLEYDAFPFSGNGVYAQSLVRGLEQQPDVVVDVVCGSPEHDEEACNSKALVKIQLPRWCSLDGACSHREFRDEAIKRLDALYEGGHPQPDLVLCVDWHAQPIGAHLRWRLGGLAMVYLNFRVFSRGRPDGFLACQEFRSVDQAWLTLALSESDAALLRAFKEDADVRVLLPPLRRDLEVRAKDRAPEERDFLTCVVRLSEEKEPERFVRLVERLAKRGAFDEGLIPVLVTGRAELDGRAELVERFLATHPSAQAFPFQTPDGLAALYARTRLNVHPPRYDAFGMSIVEAAAFGAPTVFTSVEIKIRCAFVLHAIDATPAR